MDIRPLWLVALGGAVGAASREGLSLAIPELDEVPVSIVIINVIGAFLLGYLYQAVTRLDGSRAKQLKLLLGTGFCGGFTTYSSLATDAAVLLRDDRVATAVTYALVTVLVGACATWLGIVVAARSNPSDGARRGTRGTS
ncbi:fluoride efflux transporter CrcB [Aeromicrobium chenweiae]|uniref:Fluoride-specific ion channel FluC n=1 Tax=Aeromicrobium chenweiae TaxID=2079793 RepID=A0A2S0WM06_9ACTN|nr:fluoride efflux transporter CrcB [Aeromicrobium chenweiae]AWB92332.1 fluoride efflux transporter CrcB [Aeromicrobium chenweiae]TGN31382.1 fluoride efflux transporter CrcB [Aeromicrobium chenweiae]